MEREPTEADWYDAAREAGELRRKLASIEQLVRRYNSPATEPGAHALASKVIKIIEGKQP